jgi:hypothetical protein
LPNQKLKQPGSIARRAPFLKIIVEQVCCNDKVDNHLTEDLHLFVEARVSKLIESRVVEKMPGAVLATS